MDFEAMRGAIRDATRNDYADYIVVKTSGDHYLVAVSTDNGVLYEEVASSPQHAVSKEIAKLLNLKEGLK